MKKKKKKKESSVAQLVAVMDSYEFDAVEYHFQGQKSMKDIAASLLLGWYHFHEFLY